MLRALLALFLLWPLSLTAQTLPEPLSDTISDYATILPPEVAARVTQTLTKGRTDTGVHVVLVTMERIADYGGAGQRIEDYAKKLFNQWGVGDAARDDGILILVARTDREMRIALGAGYEVMWDNAAQRVIDRHFLPAFRADDYAGGIEAGVAATFDLIATPFVAGNPPPPDPQKTWEDILPLAVFGLFATAIIGIFARSALGDALMRFKSCPSCGQRGLSRTRDILSRATRSSSGHGMMHTRCSSCGWDRSEPYTIAKQSRSSGSSSGFGGGSSSGGGASGRW
ncbi:YgcG family protein [Pseudotabrizicola sp.]|uniref:TPM domain-containing protein n=1 Tax=Pseudotabrizicola sp. TaxID=2939647 RepID=UPI0027199EAF|nr:TPM domain-containing protein [Pseudotabrizicola sp.]MDO8884500.1 TPM domain-containing protein [Pseudotabrizicola sp.]